MIVLLAAPGCGDPVLETVPASEGTTYALSVNVPFAELDVPQNCRPHGPAAERVPIVGPWENTPRREKKARARGKEWHVRMPVRPRGRFFDRAPAGMQLVTADGTTIEHRFAQTDREAPFWTCDRDILSLHGWGGEPPKAGALSVRYPLSAERSHALNHQFSGAKSVEDFVRATVQWGDESISGLLLPAPSTASFDLVVPQAAELMFRPGIAPPESMDAAPSDGAHLAVTLTLSSGEVRTLYDEDLVESRFVDIEPIPLDAYAGQTARLTFRTDPGPTGDARFDYVLVGEPLLGSRLEDPRDVYLVFVDTLRPDHTGPYGYERPTTPNLDEQAAKGVVFANARSVAPWTLPSGRALLTGRHPESWDQAKTLPLTLREHGYGTAMIAGNLYLGANFGFHRDWDRHRATLLPSAAEVVDEALAYLDAHSAHDSLILAHFMEPHLPYQEGTHAPALRHRWASTPPSQLTMEEFQITDVRPVQDQLDEAGRQYIRDRYDQNILYLDQQLERLYQRVDDNDVLVVFSDHGEEFWDHGGFEHGHTLRDELLRVPLVIRAPGIDPSVVDEPVSLLDVMPTVLDLLDLPHTGTDGASLVPAMRGDAIGARDLAFGRPLYSTERWGVLHEGHKYTTYQGREEVYDVTADPHERHDLSSQSDGADYRARLGQALGREVTPVLQLLALPTKGPPPHDQIAELTVPGGVERAWKGANASGKGNADVQIDGEVVRVTWPKGWRRELEVYVVPKRPIAEVLHRLTLIGRHDGEVHVAEPISASRSSSYDGGAPLTRIREGRGVILSWAVAVLPDPTATVLDGTNAELAGELEAMGYLVGGQ